MVSVFLLCFLRFFHKSKKRGFELDVEMCFLSIIFYNLLLIHLLSFTSVKKVKRKILEYFTDVL